MLGRVDDPDSVAVVEQVAQLAGDVAVVDVDGCRSELEAGQHRLDVLGAVLEVERDVVAPCDAQAGEVVCQAVRPLLQLGIGASLLTADDCCPLGDEIAGLLPEVGEGERLGGGHRRKLLGLDAGQMAHQGQERIKAQRVTQQGDRRIL